MSDNQNSIDEVTVENKDSKQLPKKEVNESTLVYGEDEVEHESETAQLDEDLEDLATPVASAGGRKSDTDDSELFAGFEEELSLEGQVEAIVFASPKPIKPIDILDIINGCLKEYDPRVTLAEIEECLSSLHSMYSERGGGFRLENLRKVGFQFRTVKGAASLMEKLFSTRPRPLSRAALETLAILAYKQPVTRADIEYIRGVDSGSIIKNLLERDLVCCVGRKEDSGRPMLFGTTSEFLKVFGIDSLDELPPLSSFQPSADVLKEAKAEIDDTGSIVDMSEILAGDESEPDEIAALVLQETLDTGPTNSLAFDKLDEFREGSALQGGQIDREEIRCNDEPGKNEDSGAYPATDFNSSDGDDISEES